MTFLIFSCHSVTSSQHNINDQIRENSDQENPDQSVKFGNIFINSALPSQPQFSPMSQPPYYGPRPKYGTRTGYAGFLDLLNLPYLSKLYGNPEMGLEPSGSSSDRIRFEVKCVQ